MYKGAMIQGQKGAPTLSHNELPARYTESVSCSALKRLSSSIYCKREIRTRDKQLITHPVMPRFGGAPTTNSTAPTSEACLHISFLKVSVLLISAMDEWHSS